MTSKLLKQAALASVSLCLGLSSGINQAQASAHQTSPKVNVLRKFNANQIKGKINISGYELNPNSIKLLNRSLRRKIQSIKGLNNLATLKSANSEVLELNKGLIIQSKLSYSLKPGACATYKSKLSRAGIQCGSKEDLKSSIASLSRRGSPNFISNTNKRRFAIKNLKNSQLEILKETKKARAALEDPEVISTLGAATVKRLKKMSDEDLAVEVLNTADQVIEETVFIPKAESFKNLRKVGTLKGNSLRNITKNLSTQKITKLPEYKIPKKITSPAPVDRSSTKEDIFLTGFTFGKQYEWRKKWTKSVKWCWTGCKRTYYVEPYATFGYGLGLRFPVKANLSFNSDGTRARVTPTFTPINANSGQYRQTGMRQNQVFNGQELVAEMSARAGLKMKLPFVGRKSMSRGYDRDLTDNLPAPFRNGHFTPPSPGRPLPAAAPVFLRDIDLLGGAADYGVAYAKLHPGIKMDLNSNSLQFKLKDNIRNRTYAVSSGQTRDLGIQNNRSSVTLFNPKYNLGFRITPGVQYNVGVDFAVWGKSWRDEIWIPQLSITLPPGGADFSCHANTQCSRTYSFQAS